MLSIGTGTNEHSEIDPSNISKFTWLNNINELLVGVEVSTNAFLTKQLAGKGNYNRLQTITDVELDDAD